MLWNTVYLERVCKRCGAPEIRVTVCFPTCRHWLGSINLTGDYNWRQNKQNEPGDFRPIPPLNRP